MVENSLTPNCPLAMLGNETASWEPQAAECIPQWSWFGLSCTLVVLSTLVPACWWTLEQHQEKGPNGPPDCCLCCLGIFQLSYFFEVAKFARTGKRDGDDKHASRQYSFLTAVLESTPQLYLQSQVLFALGAHGQAFKVASVCLSIATLTTSVVTFGSHRLGTWKAKAAAALFIGTDAAVRSMGFAMAFSEPIRPYGAAVAATTFVACNLYQAWSARKEGEYAALLLLPYVVPAAVMADEEEFRRLGMPVVLALRFVETIAFGILAAVFGKTACGGGLETELAIYFGLLAANALSLITFKCLLDGSGAFSTSRVRAITLGQGT